MDRGRPDLEEVAVSRLDGNIPSDGQSEGATDATVLTDETYEGKDTDDENNDSYSDDDKMFSPSEIAIMPARSIRSPYLLARAGDVESCCATIPVCLGLERIRPLVNSS